jgi:hypothetical protein
MALEARAGIAFARPIRLAYYEVAVDKARVHNGQSRDSRPTHLLAAT